LLLLTEAVNFWANSSVEHSSKINMIPNLFFIYILRQLEPV